MNTINIIYILQIIIVLFVRKKFKLFLRILPFYKYVFKIKKYKNIEFKKQKNEIKVKK